ncbi:OFA family MFS transporter [Christensenellaceae bacterium OttesenSCG-928-K19]|nr:OFA family MFS transporter [Christensenellaceae bacterium OttesenSCG-928-K19]
MQQSLNKYRPLVAGAVIQLCIGIIYIWSIFKAPVVAHYSQYVPAESAELFSSMTYSIMLALFVVGIIVGGRWGDKKGPRPVVLTGGLMFVGGILLSAASAAFAPSAPWLLCVFYGGVAGFGVGAAYTSTISCAQKWFPDKKGFATGVIVCTFGASTVIFTPLVNYLLAQVGVSQTFLTLALIYVVVILVFVWFVKNPPEEYIKQFAVTSPALAHKKQYTPSEVLRTKQYYMLLFSMMLLTTAYFILNPRFKLLAEERNLAEAAALASVMVTGIASACGRLIAPWLSDRIGRKGVVLLLFAISIAAVLLLIIAQGYFYMVLVALVAFAFGGSAGTYPAISADYFGTKHAGVNYGLVMIGFAASALIFPTITSAVNTGGGVTSILTFIIPAIACVAGVFVTLAFRPPAEKQAQ